MVYLVDSAGARITDQVQMFPGRRGAGRIFHNEVQALRASCRRSACCSGPSAAGGAYIPAFCDVVIMRDGNASMYLGSPRMAEMVIGEKVTLEEMGGAQMHTGVSGCGHFLVKTDEEAIDLARRYLSYMPDELARGSRRAAPPAEPGLRRRRSREIVPADENKPFDMQRADRRARRRGLVPRGPRALGEGADRRLRAARRARRSGSSPTSRRQKGGVLFVDSADKAARFIWTCNAFNIPLLFLADVPGFMIGTQVERQGIIRHGAKMISAVSEATVPKISVIVRKAYGAGLYAMAGPAFEPDCCIALPTRVDRRDGPAGGDQRRLLQPDPGDRGRGRARGVRREERERVRGGHRHPAPRLRARRRRGDRARRPARRDRAPVRACRRRRSASGRPKRNPVTPV